MHRFLTLLVFVALFALLTSGCSDSTSVTSVEDTTPPATPVDLVAHVGETEVALIWADNTELDFAAYNVYRQMSADAEFVLLTSTVESNLHDTIDSSGLLTVSYRISATDVTGNESATTQPIHVILDNTEPNFEETVSAPEL